LNSALKARRARFPLPLLAFVMNHLHPERYRVNEVSIKSGQPHEASNWVTYRGTAASLSLLIEAPASLPSSTALSAAAVSWGSYFLRESSTTAA